MVTLDRAKDHLRVTHDDQDDLIQSYVTAANDWIGAVGVDMTANPLPAPIQQAVLLMVGHFYDNAEGVSDRKFSAIPFGIDTLIAPYREQFSL